MGFAYRDWCYSTQASAAAKLCADSYPVNSINSSGSLVTVNCTGVDSSSDLLLSKSIDGSSSTGMTVQTAFSPCSWSDYPSSPAALSPTDGAIVAGAVATVWIAAWAWKAIYRTLDDTGSDDRE